MCTCTANRIQQEFSRVQQEGNTQRNLQQFQRPVQPLEIVPREIHVIEPEDYSMNSVYIKLSPNEQLGNAQSSDYSMTLDNFSQGHRTTPDMGQIRVSTQS